LTGVPPDGRPSAIAAPDLVEHFFRREYGRLVALLTRRAGVRYLDSVEDAVQAALLTALTSWTARGIPEDPGAWLHRVAHNHLIDDLRRKTGRQRLLAQAAGPIVQAANDPPASRFSSEVADDTLRMLFVCCDDTIPRESQLVFALKTLCGFSVAEIALRLFTSEANVYKRFARARDRLREIDPDIETPPLVALKSRLPAVQAVLYLLFNEGYLSSHAEEPIRRDLCDEAVRLATLLAEHPVSAVPETFALLALMHLHIARLGARRDPTGGLLLLEEQDRSRWDQKRLRLGAVQVLDSLIG
jgi:RNA polymerase sigma factor (sigma-70 family)